MIVIKSAIFLTILCLFGCTPNNKEIIAKYDNGKTKLERIYSDTPNCFVEKDYYDNGQLASETKFINSEKNGESIAYYKEGKILGRCIYKDGKINGEVTEYHKNGTLMFKGNQVNGKLVGLATHYYENGKSETDLFYKDNNVFLVNYWDSSNVQQVVNGNGIRKFQSFLNKDKNGNDTMINVFVVGTYKDSLHNGLWKYYNQADKTLIFERNFKNDKIISEDWK